MQQFDGRRLRSRRDEAHLTREQVAVSLGRSASAVVAWELGYSRPRLDAVERLSVLLSCDIGDFFTDADDDAVA